MEFGNLLASRGRQRVFAVVKCIVYLMLCFNVYLFLEEELLALEHTFGASFTPGQVIQVFSATIDTAAWVVLLILFELETSILEDRYIKGLVKWSLHGIRGVCYLAIVYAFTGYCAELVTLYQTVFLQGWDVCSLVDSGYSLLLDLDEYVLLSSDNCKAIGSDIYRLAGFDIISDQETLTSARSLAWTDVINSATWILVCVVLEIEVRLQLKGRLTDHIVALVSPIKLGLYGVLFVAAAYWGYAGDFLDFWDAALWLFAFIFIELNVFDWRQDTRQVATE